MNDGDAPILVLDHVTKRFGGLVAVDDISFEVARGRIFALIGPNGASKTTIFNGITGLFPPTSGRVVFEGADIAGARPHQVAALGIARTFQNIRLFEYMTALDNVRLGRHCRTHANLPQALFKTKGERTEEAAIEARAVELLRFVGIDRYTHTYARNLPYGSQRRLEIARALATDPRLLLLDEPAAGFTPQEKVELMGLVRKIIGIGVTVFLLEHDMRVVFHLADRIMVLAEGSVLAEGTPQEIAGDERVQSAYLGGAA